MKSKPSLRLRAYRKLAVVAATGTVCSLPLGACEIGDFSTTTTTTLSGREVVTFLLRSAILTPIDNLLTNAVDAFFDEYVDEDDEE